MCREVCALVFSCRGRSVRIAAASNAPDHVSLADRHHNTAPAHQRSAGGGVRSGSSSSSEIASPDASGTPRLPQLSPSSSSRFSATAIAALAQERRGADRGARHARRESPRRTTAPRPSAPAPEPILSSGTPTSPPFPQRLNLEMRLLALAPWSPALDGSSSDEPPPEVPMPPPPTAEADAADDALAKVFERSAWWLAARGAGDPARASVRYCRESH